MSLPQSEKIVKDSNILVSDTGLDTDALEDIAADADRTA